jgi:hypothetical protein
MDFDTLDMATLSCDKREKRDGDLLSRRNAISGTKPTCKPLCISYPWTNERVFDFLISQYYIKQPSLVLLYRFSSQFGTKSALAGLGQCAARVLIGRHNLVLVLWSVPIHETIRCLGLHLSCFHKRQLSIVPSRLKFFFRCLQVNGSFLVFALYSTSVRKKTFYAIRNSHLVLRSLDPHFQMPSHCSFQSFPLRFVKLFIHFVFRQARM